MIKEILKMEIREAILKAADPAPVSPPNWEALSTADLKEIA
jgi:hypothetical protein